MRKWFEKYVAPLVCLESALPLISCFVLNSLVYFGVRLIERGPYHDFTTELDRQVPFIPAFVSVYLICYLFWAVNYIMIGHLERKHFYTFIAAELLSRVVCGLFYLFLPTTNVRPEVLGRDVWSMLMRWLYETDAADNLFPSIHCLVSWFCFVGIRGKKEIPKWYRVFSCLFALLVCASTQFTKQHYLVDVFGGLALAEGMFYLSKKAKLYRVAEKIFTPLNRLIWKDSMKEYKEENKKEKCYGE